MTQRVRLRRVRDSRSTLVQSLVRHNTFSRGIFDRLPVISAAKDAAQWADDHNMKGKVGGAAKDACNYTTYNPWGEGTERAEVEQATLL